MSFNNSVNTVHYYAELTRRLH